MYELKTLSGHLINLSKGPQLDQIELDDIAHSLAMQPRFAGHINRHYSIAEHSVYVSMIAPKIHQPYYLLHDAPEYIYQDITKPLKDFIGQMTDRYDKASDNCMQQILKKYRLSITGFVNLKKEIKKADLFVYDLEDKVIRRNLPSNLSTNHPLYEAPFGMSWQEAKQLFIDTFESLGLNHQPELY